MKTKIIRGLLAFAVPIGMLFAMGWKPSFMQSNWYKDKVAIHAWIVDDAQLRELYTSDEWHDPVQKPYAELDQTWDYLVIRAENLNWCHVSGNLFVQTDIGHYTFPVSLGPRGNNPTSEYFHPSYLVFPFSRRAVDCRHSDAPEMPTFEFKWKSIMAQ